ncbi:MAG: DUF6266 family protein [Marinifilaceae bacterium]
MARLKSKILEKAAGQLGQLVVYNVGENTYVRTKPSQYRDRKTETQLAQRQKFRLVMNFLRPFTKMLRLTFSDEKGIRKGFHPAKSYNLRHGICGNYPNQSIDRQKALLSKGPLPLPLQARVTRKEEGVLFEWKPNNEPETATDTLLVMALAPHPSSSDYRFTGIKRSEGQFLWNTPLNSSNQPVEFWLAFRNQEESLMSNSLYLGKQPL